MKKMKFFLSMFVLTAMLLSTTSQAQIYAVVDFMKVPEGGDGEYLKVEQEMWKPMHQEWVNTGNLDSWSLWSIPYPGGTDAEYHYATVRIYTDDSQLENTMNNMDAVFKKVHPGMDADKAFDRTLASRDLVKTHMLYNWESYHDTTQAGPDTYLTVVYFKIPMKNWDTYREMERKYFLPTHKAEMEVGCRSGWDGYQLIRPFGMGQDYQFVAVDFYKDFKQYMKPRPKGLNEKVLSEADLKTRDQLFDDTVELVSLEEWRFIDGTAPRPVKK